MSLHNTRKLTLLEWWWLPKHTHENRVSRSNKCPKSIPALEVNNTIIDTGLDKACALNNFFYGYFNHNYPTIQETSLDSQLLSSTDCPSELLCTEEGVHEELTSLDVGSDGISGKMLKMTAISIAPQLTTLFNISISTGRFPSDWKVGRIVPIPKGKQNNKLTMQLHPDLSITDCW